MQSYDAIVVGAGHNGLTCACYLGRAGLRVKVVERKVVPIESVRRGDVVLGQSGWVRVVRSWQTGIRPVVERFGHLDILVNNAGIGVLGVTGDPANDLAGFQRQYAVNVGGVAAAVRAAAVVMGKGGRIITIGSCVAVRVPFPGIADYAATKGAVAA